MLGIVYGLDIYEHHDDGTMLASAMVVDTGITLGPPAPGAAAGFFWTWTWYGPGHRCWLHYVHYSESPC